MNWGLLLFLATAPFFNSCIAIGIPSNGSDVALSNGEVQQKPKLKLNELNDDILFTIFDFFEMNDLVYMLEAYPAEFSVIASSIFRNRYKTREIIVTSRFTYGPNPQAEFHDFGNYNDLYIFKLPFYVKVMKHFGNDVERLRIDHTGMGVDWTGTGGIQQYINGSESGVRELKMQIQYDEMKKGVQPPLNKQFPYIQYLEMYSYSNIDYSFIACEFSELVSANLSISGRGNPKEQIVEFMRKNPQIQTLELQWLRADVIRCIDEMLPNLENLTLTLYDSDGGEEPIHFANVRNLTLYMKYSPRERFVENWTFSQLESLSIEYYITLCGVWMEFFRNNPTIKRLELTNQNNIIDMDLAELTSSLMDLTEMNVKSRYFVSCDHIGQFIRNHPKLERFQFLIYEYPDEASNELRAQFGNEWNIQEIQDRDGYKGLSFEKKE